MTAERPLRYRDGDDVWLTPVAFELYQHAQAMRADRPLWEVLTGPAHDLYWEAMAAEADERAGRRASRNLDVATVLETAAETADYEGL